MVNYPSAPLDATFGALADPTRRAILARLAQGEAMVTELAEPFRISLPAISKHVKPRACSNAKSMAGFTVADWLHSR
jgi:DNA-binding transcriptional ArsR family regulator